MMIWKLSKILWPVLLFFTVTEAAAHPHAHPTLLEVFQRALANDQQYAAAKAAWLAAQETLPQNIANILPSLSASAITAGNKRRTTEANVFRFNTQIYSLTLTQPLINFASWSRIQEANANVKKAAATLLAARQKLIIRVASAYFNILLAQDTLRFTNAELQATYRQLEQARQRYKVGLVAITAVYEARAVYDQILADRISAKNNLDNAKENLRQITNHYYDKIAALRHRIPLLRPIPAQKQAWVQSAINHNYTYLASRFSADAARSEIGAVWSGHLPSLNLTGNINRNKSGVTNAFFNELSTSTHTLGLQLSIPLLQGGSVVSQTRAAQATYEQAVANRIETFRSVVVSTRQTFNSIIAGLSKISADRRSIASGRSSLDSTEAAYKVGTRTIVDVLQVQRNLFRAQEIHAQDQYNLINNTLSLKALAGTLREADLAAIDKWLQR